MGNAEVKRGPGETLLVADGFVPEMRTHHESSGKKRNMRTRFVVVTSLLLGTLGSFSSGIAHAQPEPAPTTEPTPPEQPDRSKELFDEGRQLMAEGKYAQACPKLAESHKLKPGIGTLYNLADCHDKNGEVELAYTEFSEVVQRTKAALQEDRQRDAEARLKEITAKVARVVVSVPATRYKVEILLDNKKLPKEKWNKEMIIVAGDHTVRATTDQDDGDPYEDTVTLEGGGKKTVINIPVAPGAKMSRRPGLIIAGSILMGVGTVAGLGTGALMSADNAEAGPIVGLGVLTIASLAVGIPLFVVGMKKRPVREAFLEPLPIEASPIPQIGIGPTGGSATWHF